eukprot:5977734-Pleurochrysis_carterae.AAC.1
MPGDSTSACPLASPPSSSACTQAREESLQRAWRHVASGLPRSKQPHRRHVRRDGVGAQRRARSAGLPRA